MPLSNSVTINFNSTDYTSNKPSFGADGGYATNLKFANITKTLYLEGTGHGYAIFEIGYTGSVDYVSVAFLNPNGGEVSVSTELNGLYKVSKSNFILENIILSDKVVGGTKTYYVIVNADQTNVSDYLTVSVAIGKYNTAPSTSSVTIGYECPTTVYSYTTGLHVYSPYDAKAGTSKLTTKLYSLTPIGSWTTDTVVYSSPSLNNPALPYYYGYGTNVYKIGGEFDRAYGTKKEYTVKKKLFGKTNITEKTIGPTSFFNSGNQTSEACVVPTMNGVGLVKGIYANSSLSQPQQYRYYMGYNSSTKTMSNDSVFTRYSFARKTQDAITGASHALEKITSGVISGYNTSWKLDGWALAVSAIGLAGLIPGVATVYTTIEVAISHFFDYLIGPFIPQWLTLGSGATAFLSAAIPWLLTAILIFAILKLIFSTKTIIYSEPCKIFLHHFTNSPYIENGVTLYRDQGNSVVNNGYYCDGVYYYQQSGGVIGNKELSYTNAIVNDNPAVYEFQYSLKVDDPTLVTDWSKLIVLPYTSGKPQPYCGGSTIYYNTGKTQTITNTCCDLETCESVTIAISAGTIFSCVSQADVNAKELAKFTAAVQIAQNIGNYTTPFTDYQRGELDTYFTHEIKVETNPTSVTIYYDSRNTGAIIGKKLYYDQCGCTPVLNGYYAITGNTYYRTFYHTTSGTIDGIYYMSSSNSTTTTTSEPIISTNLDYSSNWYLFGDNQASLDVYCSGLENNRTYNPNDLYSNTSLKKGFIKTPTTLEDFQHYVNFNTTSYSEANTGWYKPLIDWIENDSFYYHKTQTITLDLKEYCPTGSTTTRGFYVVGKSGSVETPTINAVNLTVNAYSTGNVLTGTYNVTTSKSESKTFVNYGSQVQSNETITNLEISAITSPNPQNKITYSVGTKTLCLANCNLTLSFTSTNPTNQAGDNGTATVTVSGGVSNYTYTWSNGKTTTTSSTNNTVTGLTQNVQYTVTVVDGNGCSKSGTITVGQSTFVFDADYIMLTYQFTDGLDLDTRTRIVTPNVGQTGSTSTYLGFGYASKWPTTAANSDAIERWGGDNQGTGYESVLINLTKFRTSYPTATSLVVDCRAFWYYSNHIGTQPVKVAATLWKGGAITGPSNFVFANPTATGTETVNSVSLVVTQYNPGGGGYTRGQRIATLTYDLTTNTGTFNNNDTTTPTL